MTALRQRMLEELQRHNYSKETIRLYLFAVKDFARYFRKSPDLLTQEHMREFQLYLLNERKLTAQTVAGRITALRFFFVKCCAAHIRNSTSSIRNCPSGCPQS